MLKAGRWVIEVLRGKERRVKEESMIIYTQDTD